MHQLTCQCGGDSDSVGIVPSSSSSVCSHFHHTSCFRPQASQCPEGVSADIRHGCVVSTVVPHLVVCYCSMVF